MTSTAHNLPPQHLSSVMDVMSCSQHCMHFMTISNVYLKLCNGALASSLPRVKSSSYHLPIHYQNLEVLQGNMSLTCILPLTKVVISSSLSKMDRVCSKLFSSHSQCFVISLRDDPSWRGEIWREEQRKKKLEQTIFFSPSL